MSEQSQTAEICALFALIVRAMVSDPDGVEVLPIPSAGPAIVLQVRAAKGDVGKVIGKQGRTARSLRIILASIAKEHGGNFSLDVAGVPVETFHEEGSNGDQGQEVHRRSRPND